MRELDEIRANTGQTLPLPFIHVQAFRLGSGDADCHAAHFFRLSDKERLWEKRMKPYRGYKVVSYSHANPNNRFDRMLLRASVVPDGHGGILVSINPTF